MTDLDSLMPFATTVRQVEVLESVIAHGSNNKAAKAIGITRRSVDQLMARLRAAAAHQGIAPAHGLVHAVPDGFRMRGASVYREKTEDHPAHWLKMTEDVQRQREIFQMFAQELAESVKGLAPPVAPPAHSDEDLLCVYPMGDPHFGMYAWWEDAGSSFDLAEAERVTCAAVDRLVLSAPAAKTALLLNLGDMFHADNQGNTSKSGHQLDVDGRRAKVQQVALRAMVHCIRRLLERHQVVHFRINKGNHDEETSYALALMLSCWFHNEPRVVVDLSPGPFWYFRFGEVLLGSTHGDRTKGPDLVPVMAADRPADWGATRHRYWYVGHVHHQDLKEYRGGIVEYFRTLAARDAWHQGQGYRAGRDMRLIVHHRVHGEVERHNCDVGMIAAG